MKIEQVHVYYSGMVQGVGFRYQVKNIAANFPLTGWVKNLPNGSVELIAEASKKTLLDFLKNIDATLNQYIRDKQVSWDKAENNFKCFEINF